MNRLLCFLLLWLSSWVDQSQSSSYLLQRLKSSNLAFFKRCSNQFQKIIPTSTKNNPFIGIRDESMIVLRGGSNVGSDDNDDDDTNEEESVVVLGNTQTTHKSSKSHSKSPLHQRSLKQTPKRIKKRRSHHNVKLVGQSHVKPSVSSYNQDNHGDAAKSLGEKTPILRLSSSSSSVGTGTTSHYSSNTEGQGTKDHNKIRESLPKRKKKSKGNRIPTIGGTIRTTSMVDDTSPLSSSIDKETRTLTRHKKKKKKSARRPQNLLDKDDACDKELKPIHSNNSDNGKKKKKKKKKKAQLSTTTSKTRQKEIHQHEMDDKNGFLDEGNTENNEPVVPLNTEMTNPSVNETTVKQKTKKKKTKKRKRKSSGVSTKPVDTSSRNEKEDVEHNGDNVDVSIQVPNVTETLGNITDDSVSNPFEDGDGGDIQSMVERHFSAKGHESEIDTQEQKEKSVPGLILKDAAVVLEAELALRVEEDERRAMASDRNEEQIAIEDSKQHEEEVERETDDDTDASIEVDAMKTVITIEDSEQDEEEDVREPDASIEVDAIKTVDNESNVVAIENALDDERDEMESQESIAPVNQESDVQLHDNLESKGVSDTEEYATYKSSVEEKDVDSMDSVSSSNDVEQEVYRSKEDELHSRVSEAIFILEEVTVHENETEKKDVPQVDSSLDVKEFKTCTDDEKEEPIISINMKESMTLETVVDDENEDGSSLKSFEDSDSEEGLGNAQAGDDDSDVETKPYSRQMSDSTTDLSSLVGEHEQSDEKQSVGSDESTICLSDKNNADEERTSSGGDSSKTGEGCTEDNQNYSDDLDVNSIVEYDALKDATDSEELEEDAERRNDIDEEDDTSDDDHSDDEKFQYEGRKVMEDASALSVDSGNDNDEASNDSNSQQESKNNFHDETHGSGTGLSDASDTLKIESAGEETFEKTVTDVDTSEITVSVITWNLAELSPSDDEASFMKKFRTSNGKGSDLVLFGCQETENTKPRRNEGSRSREIRRILIHMLGKKYVPIAIHSLGGVQMALFCKKSLLCDLEHVSLADVACGIGNVFHNKGGIGAFVQLRARNPDESLNERDRAKSVKILLVVCHLAAHVKKVDARNADYWRIISELEAKAPPSFLRPSTDPTLNGGEHLLNAMDHVVFAGDLNYRIDLPREEVEKMILEMKSSENDDEKDYSFQNRLKLLRHDQLLKTISQGSAFKDMVEGEITFAPTFKYDKGTKTYDSSHKLRIPAWTDRILFRPFGVRLQEYNCVPEATHSDHRPVYATLLMKLEGRHVEQSTGTTKKKRKRTTKSKKQ